MDVETKEDTLAEQDNHSSNVLEKHYWTSADIYKLFRLNERVKSRQTLFNAEERGEIPKAVRIARGSLKVRQWRIDQIPEIGARFGFLEKPTKQIVACMYTPKGGVLKTTVGYNFARALALNGIKTLIIGLDLIQGSITNYALPSQPIESLEDLTSEHLSLYHFFFEKAALSEIVQKTSLPTLHVIPETLDLHVLEKKLTVQTRREYLFKDKLIKELSGYDVILFDNGPGWSHLVENALTASNVLISPLGCDIEAFKAIDNNLSAIIEFKEAMNIEWDDFIQIPTLLEKAKLSQQIYGVYLNKFADQIIPIPIRRSISGQEARALNRSTLEHDPTSNLAQDYYDVIQEMWRRILKSTSHGS